MPLQRNSKELGLRNKGGGHHGAEGRSWSRQQERSWKEMEGLRSRDKAHLGEVHWLIKQRQGQTRWRTGRIRESCSSDRNQFALQLIPKWEKEEGWKRLNPEAGRMVSRDRKLCLWGVSRSQGRRPGSSVMGTLVRKRPDKSQLRCPVQWRVGNPHGWVSVLDSSPSKEVVHPENVMNAGCTKKWMSSQGGEKKNSDPLPHVNSTGLCQDIGFSAAHKYCHPEHHSHRHQVLRHIRTLWIACRCCGKSSSYPTPEKGISVTPFYRWGESSERWSILPEGAPLGSEVRSVNSKSPSPDRGPRGRGTSLPISPKRRLRPIN